MKTALAISHLTVTPGQSAQIEVGVTNTGEVIDGVTAIVDGINPDWVRLERPLVSVFPDATDTVVVVFDIPKSCPAGDYLVVVRIVSTIDDERQGVQDFWLTVTETLDLDVTLSPSIVSGGGSATLTATVHNRSNTGVDVTVNAWEPTRVIDATVEPQSLVLPYGESADVEVDLRGPRPWFGQPLPYSIIVSAQVGETVVEKTATFNQKPRIPRGVITAMILAAIIVLWALIFLWVMSEVRGRDQPTKILATDFFGGAANMPLAAVAGTASGQVTAVTTGDGIERITVEANRISDDELQAVGSVATDVDGNFSLPALLPGTYKLRFSADGFDDVWYPDSATSDGAAAIPVVPASVATDDELAASTGLDIQMGGQAGRLVGVVALPADAPIVPLTITATIVDADTTGPTAGTDVGDGVVVDDGSSPAASADPVSFTQETTDGRIDIDGLPTPATYEVSISGPGFDTQTVRQELGGGASTVLNTVRMSAATGSLAGVVVDQSGSRVGDVTVTARAGDIVVEANTPTSGDTGAFAFVGLETPQTYVLTFERAGYSSASLALALNPGEARDGLVATIVGGDGTLNGVVVDSSGVPVGGASVEVIGGDVTAESATLTTGSPGTFTVSGLPVPNRYAVTIIADGYQPETVDGTLLAAGARSVGTVTLLRETAEVRGTVSVDGRGAGDVIVTLHDGITGRSTLSATNPAGVFAFSSVAAGAYTLTFERTGLEQRVVLVDIQPGASIDRSVTLRAEVIS
ncbi:MAG: carboxypeptidase regulatory-like domain-containing protein [Ilumatobacter sp.]|uniref:carboxypeptidase regulatory-like domain-containing protein n=1 Tax=Ilumatobacter sp. TaxID=1967498 RepID=UPI0039187B70